MLASSSGIGDLNPLAFYLCGQPPDLESHNTAKAQVLKGLVILVAENEMEALPLAIVRLLIRGDGLLRQVLVVTRQEIRRCKVGRDDNGGIERSAAAGRCQKRAEACTEPTMHMRAVARSLCEYTRRKPLSYSYSTDPSFTISKRSRGTKH